MYELHVLTCGKQATDQISIFLVTDNFWVTCHVTGSIIIIIIVIFSPFYSWIKQKTDGLGLIFKTFMYKFSLSIMEQI